MGSLNSFRVYIESFGDSILGSALLGGYDVIYPMIESVNINKAYLISLGGPDGFAQSKSYVDGLWQKNQMSTYIKKSDKILNFLYLMQLKSPGLVSDDTMHVLSDMVATNRLHLLASLNSDTTPDEFDQFISKQRREHNGLGNLCANEAMVWSRVKTIHDFGDGYAWVIAVDDNGVPVTHMPSDIANKMAKHCGNEPTRKVGDTYVELRKNNKPYITVILDKNGNIFESKPVGNDRSYIDFNELRDYFKWLLMWDGLRGVTDSYDNGYAADHNIGIKDYFDDDEFVEHVKINKPGLISPREPMLMEYKRKYAKDESVYDDVIEDFMNSKLRLSDVRYILGKIPFSESQLVDLIKSGRLTAMDISDTKTALLTPNVQSALLKYDTNNPDLVLTNVYREVPHNPIDISMVFKHNPDIVLKRLSGKPDVIEKFIVNSASAISEYIRRRPYSLLNSIDDINLRLRVLSKYMDDVLVGFRYQPAVLKLMTDDMFLHFIDRYPDVFCKALEGNVKGVIVSIPRKFLHTVIYKYHDSFIKGISVYGAVLSDISNDIILHLLDTHIDVFFKHPKAFLSIPKPIMEDVVIEKYGDIIGKFMSHDAALIQIIPFDQVSFIRKYYNYFVQGLSKTPRALSEYVHQEDRRPLVRRHGELLEFDPYLIGDIPEATLPEFLDKFGEFLKKGLKRHPDAIFNVPEQFRGRFE